MAINTRGFRLNVMPQYTPVDPSLVAFNPSAAMDGMTMAYKRAQLKDEIMASRAKQAELEATRQNRIAAENARNQAITTESIANLPVFDARVGDEIAEIGFRGATRGKRKDATLSGFDVQMAQDASNLELLPGRTARLAAEDKYGKEKADVGLSAIEPMTEADIAKANAEKAAAESSVALQPLKQEATQALLQLEKLQNTYRAVNAPAQAVAEAQDIALHLGNAETAQELSNALKRAQILLMGSQTAENYAQSSGRNGKTEKEILLAERTKLIQDLRNLQSTPIPGGRTLQVYDANTYEYDEKGNREVQDPMFGFKKTRNKFGDDLLTETEALNKRIAEIGARIRQLESLPEGQQTMQRMSTPTPAIGSSMAAPAPSNGGRVRFGLDANGNPVQK